MKSRQLLFVLTFLLPGIIQSQTMNARFSTSVYTWEDQFNDQTAAKSFRGYQTAMFQVNGLKWDNLSFNTYLRSTYDFGTESKDNPDYRIYNMYLRWRTPDKNKHKFDARVGRQQVFTGMRSPTIDGIRADYSYKNNFNFMGYFGALPPADGGASLLKPFLRRSWGLKLSTSKLWATNASITYFDKSREGPYYYTENSFGFDSLVTRPDLKERIVGFDVNRMFLKKLNVFGNAQYNALEKNIQRASGDFQYTPNDDWFVAVQYLYRRPLLLYNSIFSAFDDIRSNQEIWMRAHYRINECWGVNGEYANVFYKMKDAWRYGLGVTFMRTGFQYQRRMGYGGTMDAFTASAYYPINNRLKVNGAVSYTRFDLADDITPGDVDTTTASPAVLRNTNTAWSAIARINYQFFRSFNVDVEGQLLSQNIKSSPVFAGSKYDVRFFVRANYWIFKRI